MKPGFPWAVHTISLLIDIFSTIKRQYALKYTNVNIDDTLENNIAINEAD